MILSNLQNIVSIFEKNFFWMQINLYQIEIVIMNPKTIGVVDESKTFSNELSSL